MLRAPYTHSFGLAVVSTTLTDTYAKPTGNERQIAWAPASLNWEPDVFLYRFEHQPTCNITHIHRWGRFRHLWQMLRCHLMCRPAQNSGKNTHRQHSMCTAQHVRQLPALKSHVACRRPSLPMVFSAIRLTLWPGSTGVSCQPLCKCTTTCS